MLGSGAVSLLGLSGEVALPGCGCVALLGCDRAARLLRRATR